MTKYPFLLTVLSAGLFFFFGVATSKTYPPVSEHTIDLMVELVDSTLILSNEDTLDFDDAQLDLTYFDRDTVWANGFVDSIYEGGTISNYSIAIGEIDTIPLSEFLDQNSLPFPVDTMPEYFFFRTNMGFRATFEHEF